MHPQHHRTEDVAQRQQAEEVVRVKLNVGGVSGPRAHQQAPRLRQKAVHHLLRPLPQLNRQLDDVRHQTEGGEGTVEEEGEERALDGLVVEGGGALLGRHQHDEGLAKVAGNVLEGGAVVRVDDEEERAADKGVEVARVEAVDVLGGGGRGNGRGGGACRPRPRVVSQLARVAVARVGGDAAVVVADWGKIWLENK